MFLLWYKPSDLHKSVKEIITVYELGFVGANITGHAMSYTVSFMTGRHYFVMKVAWTHRNNEECHVMRRAC
jgi:hypothetical protein